MVQKPVPHQSEARGEGALATPDAGKSCFVFVFAFALRCVAMRCDACVRASGGGGGARLGRDFKVIIHGAGPKHQVANTISLPTPRPETGDPGIAQGDPGIAQGLLKWPLWLGWAGWAGLARLAGLAGLAGLYALCPLCGYSPFSPNPPRPPITLCVAL